MYYNTVVKQALVTHCILWVKHIRCWRVVNNDNFVQISAQPAQILQVNSNINSFPQM